ncbi:DUF418 domain-containing protein [Actinotalea ferrariae]|uniref:DUF418 domain-containing protein n=1 Tax=Actinotalea ferrariae TaxID=1386098 RepID=UPI001C8CC60A|nr:DUF418 domain-containing protein [Actinotalea ferrariae]MBX9243868.1 DUF418 domain-containing protein [Actinotalea ferrariae]
MSQYPTTTAPAPPAPLPGGGPAPVSPPTPRSLAPDLARGMLLLLIALANVWGYLWSDAGSDAAGGRPVGGSPLDHLVDGVTTLLVDSHVKPMFAILYGFGLATMAGRLAARGAHPRTTRGVLGRRGVALIVLGLVHATLLYGGDILAPYGAAGLLALLFLHRSRVALAWWFCVAYGVSMSAGAVALLAPSDPGGASGATEPTTTTYVTSAVERLTATATVTSLYTLTLMFVPHLVVGILLARAGWLTRPAEHRRRLGQVAAVAAAVSLVGSAPYALAVAQVWHPDHTGLAVAELVHHVSGDVMGLGYVCLFGWLAAVWSGLPRRGPVAAVTAVGERSLTCYLLQSVMFAPLLSDWGLGLGEHLSTTQAAVLAVAVWLVTVAVAVALQRAGRRGPFEVALRRIAYGQAHDHR